MEKIRFCLTQTHTQKKINVKDLNLTRSPSAKQMVVYYVYFIFFDFTLAIIGGFRDKITRVYSSGTELVHFHFSFFPFQCLNSFVYTNSMNRLNIYDL